MADSPGIFAIFYLLNTLLDEFDGYYSRKLNQTSKFGALLDMLIDRCVTTCLMVSLSNVYSSYRILFQFLISLDVSSHWFHMYSSMIKGDKSHKTTTNFFLKLYYESWSVLTMMCWGNEVFFVMLYLIHFSYGPTVFTLNNAPVGLWSLLVYVSFPICFLKQLVSVVQLMVASQDVVAYDMAERRKSKS
ncbi:CDP-diacylglycerol--inositol 3-phosphatidyltransferase [Paramuricea clavata]|uniref:CDP-diacylglycerol--inositol 3-phosphatidyltransferase n=1 Tax=Paramuricea clavata TaxID=317549 RepID=A0A7D9HHA9_PARCT|nr:CDP-diacylglycerol--inositol 3-phosphatidyltransferase [Paramuricea clavata]